MRTVSLRLGFLLVGVMAFALGGISSAAAADTGDGLAGSEWRPTHIGERTIPEKTKMFVQFRGEGKLGGHAGCNRFFGTYKASGETLEIGPMGVTQMMCPEPAMTEERALLSALETAERFLRERVDLKLFDADGNEIARFAQTDWD